MSKKTCTLGSYSTSTSYAEYYQVRLSSVLTYSHLPSIKQRKGNPRGRTGAGCPTRRPATITPGAKPAARAPSKPRKTHAPALPRLGMQERPPGPSHSCLGSARVRRDQALAPLLPLPNPSDLRSRTPLALPAGSRRLLPGKPQPPNTTARKRSAFKSKPLQTFKGQTTKQHKSNHGLEERPRAKQGSQSTYVIPLPSSPNSTGSWSRQKLVFFLETREEASEANSSTSGDIIVIFWRHSNSMG